MRYKFTCWSLIVLAALATNDQRPTTNDRRASRRWSLVEARKQKSRWSRAQRACTPMAPLEIELTPLPRQKRDPKGEQRLRVQVTPLVDAVWLEVELSLPPGVTLLQGETQWRVPARARRTQTRELHLKVPGSGERRVVATAQLLFRRSLPMGCATSYTFHENVVGRGRGATDPTDRPHRSDPPREPPSFPTIPARH
jgi:hypothetical protein